MATAINIASTKSSYEYIFKSLDFNHRSRHLADIGASIDQLTTTNEELRKKCDEKMVQVYPKLEASKASSAILQDARQQFDSLNKTVEADSVKIKALSDQFKNITKPGEKPASALVLETLESNIGDRASDQKVNDAKITATYRKFYNQLSDTARVGLEAPPPSSPGMSSSSGSS